MSETLIKLIESNQNEKRLLQRKYFLESSIADTKINLISKNLKNEFKYGVPYSIFLKIFNNEVINCMLFDLVIYDFVVLNIGKKTILSMVKNFDIDLSDKYIQIPVTALKAHILNIVSVFYNKESIVILFEISDNEGRLIIKPKDIFPKKWPSIKFIDFSLNNFLILDP